MKWREKWISGGMEWDSPEIPKPPNWNPREQLQRIGVEI
jgi:hypothetical protein